MIGRILLLTGITLATLYGIYRFPLVQKSGQQVATMVTDVLFEQEIQSEKTIGLIMFRGNTTRTFYGTGPVPKNPSILWQYPEKNPLCGFSVVKRERRQWCGSGWTGQPVVWERPDGITEIIVGTYDKSIHFINATTGEQTRTPFLTGDIIKGSVTLDPDGFPLLYSGSRDNFYRIIALDRDTPTELWRKEARVSDGYWNNDWDSNGLIEDDILYQGSENGIFHIIKLNRSFDESGLVQVAPETLLEIPTFSKEFLSLLGDTDVSIESSPMKLGSVVYVANSGGRILGFDVSKVETKEAPIVFDFWTGDDTDATLIADEDGFIYAVSEDERKNARSKEIGQIIKLDPKNPTNPLVWNVHVPGTSFITGGVWATPALFKNHLYVPTNPGELLTINTSTGDVVHKTPIGTHAWSSPNIVEDTLIIGTCEGDLKAFNITTPQSPTLLWTLPIKNRGCIESTPAVWKGNMYFGTREGFLFKVGEK